MDLQFFTVHLEQSTEVYTSALYNRQWYKDYQSRGGNSHMGGNGRVQIDNEKKEIRKPYAMKIPNSFHELQLLKLD